MVNSEGLHFINELAYRDVLAGAIIREIRKGRGITTPNGKQGIWLDTPMIDLKNGEGTLANQFPGLMHRFERYKIDPVKLEIKPLIILSNNFNKTHLHLIEVDLVIHH